MSHFFHTEWQANPERNALMHATLTSPRRDETYSVPASEVVSNRLVARGDGISSPGFMIAHLIWLLFYPGSMHTRHTSECLSAE